MAAASVSEHTQPFRQVELAFLQPSEDCIRPVGKAGEAPVALRIKKPKYYSALICNAQ